MPPATQARRRALPTTRIASPPQGTESAGGWRSYRVHLGSNRSGQAATEGGEQVAGRSDVRIVVLGVACMLLYPCGADGRELRSAAPPAGTTVLGPSSL